MKRLMCYIFGHRPETVHVESIFEMSGSFLLRHRCARCNQQINPKTNEPVDWRPYD